MINLTVNYAHHRRAEEWFIYYDVNEETVDKVRDAVARDLPWLVFRHREIDYHINLRKIIDLRLSEDYWKPESRKVSKNNRPPTYDRRKNRQ